MTTFTLRFTATPRGARLARRLASHQMDAWGWPYGTPAHDAVELVVAELAANAVTHGRVDGRDAELRLSTEPGRVRAEVSDTRGERLPHRPPGDRADADGGRGLALVAALAEDWGVVPRAGSPGKTVWALVAAPAVPEGRAGDHGRPCRPLDAAEARALLLTAPLPRTGTRTAP